ncbi:MAG TPA: AMP-binding protein [Candidatus Eisenbacteria bacterium]|nr:AMP-binding protein [Candidatus Eisenbacteria bacterium]
MTPSRDLYTGFVAHVLFPLHERVKGHATYRRLREMERSQWWSAADLEAFRLERLRRFLAAAGARVPYYRDLFRGAGFDPAAVRSTRDLAALPLLTKPIIRANLESMKAEGAGPLTRYATGGSTGEPLRFFVGKARISSDVAARCRARRWWGLDVGDREFVLWGSHIELTNQGRLQAVRDRFLRSRLFSANRLSSEILDGYLDALDRFRPTQIFSHPSALSELARQAELRGRNVSGLGIRVAFLTAEELYEHQKILIERVFGCRVANGYGGRDAGFVSHECPEGGMHLNAEDVIVEILDEAGRPLPRGESGEIVVTHLESGDFPFVRYRTGDMGVLDDSVCRCGRGLPLLGAIHGRADDLLLSLDGARLPGQVAVLLLRDVPGLRAFKIVQEARDLVRLLLVKTDEFPAGAEAALAKGLRGQLGEGMRVEFDTVESIPREASGKYRTVVSRVGVSPTLESGATGPGSGGGLR